MPLLRHLPGFFLGAAVSAMMCLAFVDSPPLPQDSPPPNALPASPPTAPGKEWGHSVLPVSGSSSFDLETALNELLAEPHPLLRIAQLTTLGYQAAAHDPNEAQARIDRLSNQAEKVAYLKGMFTRIAEDKPPYEAIQRVKRLRKNLETEGFRTLIAQWTGVALDESLSFQDAFRTLLTHKEVDPEIKQAWMKAYQNHPHRNAMAAAWAGALVNEAPEQAVALGDALTGWERETFMGQLARKWIRVDPEKAWDWLNQHPEEISGETLASVVGSWATSDPEAALEAFDTLTDPQARVAAAAQIARQQAVTAGTRESLAWADSLPTEEEQAAAHEAIYVATPRGIGAALSTNDGTVTVGDILPNTPAALSGLQKGDRIVQVDPGDGSFHSLSAANGNLEQAVNLIRGEAGTALRLRVLRPGGASEVIEINRQQLVFDAQD